ncbi:hypothetical protein ABLE91_07725 [Aquabacter sp. CN5-332]|uniref:hypothetical protein n=1 Tax=Aquabacter sp. CN5-332 TaxID=3156608 RepID=UPI0032B624D0
MHSMRIAPPLCAAALVIWAVTAAADPLPVPETDFALKAKLQQGATMEMAHSGAKIRVLISGPNLPASTLGIIDMKRGKMLMMLPDVPKAAVEADVPPAYRAAMLKGEGTRMGPGEVAGQPCEIWRVDKSEAVGGPAFACITADGIPLRTEVEVKGKRQIAYEAMSVTRAPQDPALFRLPPGTQTLKIPPGAAGLLPGLGGLLKN